MPFRFDSGAVFELGFESIVILFCSCSYVHLIPVSRLFKNYNLIFAVLRGAMSLDSCTTVHKEDRSFSVAVCCF